MTDIRRSEARAGVELEDGAAANRALFQANGLLLLLVAGISGVVTGYFWPVARVPVGRGYGFDGQPHDTSAMGLFLTAAILAVFAVTTSSAALFGLREISAQSKKAFPARLVLELAACIALVVVLSALANQQPLCPTAEACHAR